VLAPACLCLFRINWGTKAIRVKIDRFEGFGFALKMASLICCQFDLVKGVLIKVISKFVMVWQIWQKPNRALTKLLTTGVVYNL